MYKCLDDTNTTLKRIYAYILHRSEICLSGVNQKIYVSISLWIFRYKGVIVRVERKISQ